MASTKPVYRKPTSRCQGKSQDLLGSAKGCLGQWRRYALSVLVTYFQLLHLESSEKWSQYLLLKLCDDFALFVMFTSC